MSSKHDQRRKRVAHLWRPSVSSPARAYEPGTPNLAA